MKVWFKLKNIDPYLIPDASYRTIMKENCDFLKELNLWFISIGLNIEQYCPTFLDQKDHMNGIVKYHLSLEVPDDVATLVKLKFGEVII